MRLYLVRAIVKYGQYWVCMIRLSTALTLPVLCLFGPCLSGSGVWQRQQQTRAKQTYAYNLKRWFGLLNVARAACVNENVFFLIVRLRQSNPNWSFRIQSWDCDKVAGNYSTDEHCALLSKWNHDGYQSSMSPMQFREWLSKHGTRPQWRAVWLTLHL